jgi:hypothetical protein
MDINLNNAVYESYENVYLLVKKIDVNGIFIGALLNYIPTLQQIDDISNLNYLFVYFSNDTNYDFGEAGVIENVPQELLSYTGYIVFEIQNNTTYEIVSRNNKTLFELERDGCVCAAKNIVEYAVENDIPSFPQRSVRIEIGNLNFRKLNIDCSFYISFYKLNSENIKCKIERGDYFVHTATLPIDNNRKMIFDFAERGELVYWGSADQFLSNEKYLFRVDCIGEVAENNLVDCAEVDRDIVDYAEICLTSEDVLSSSESESSEDLYENSVGIISDIGVQSIDARLINVVTKINNVSICNGSDSSSTIPSIYQKSINIGTISPKGNAVLSLQLSVPNTKIYNVKMGIKSDSGIGYENIRYSITSERSISAYSPFTGINSLKNPNSPHNIQIPNQTQNQTMYVNINIKNDITSFGVKILKFVWFFDYAK